jgi:hypothetical protein
LTFEQGLACGASRRLKGSWQGLLQKGDGLPKLRRSDDPLAIPRLRARRLEVGEERYYQVDGLTLPSVSTVLRVIAKPNLVSWARRTTLTVVRQLLEEGLSIEVALALAEVEPERQRDAAAQRGGLVHEAIACAIKKGSYAAGEEDPRVRAALSFLTDYGLDCVAVELMVWSLRHRYAGTIDLVARQADGALTLVDWKTGGIWVEASLQVAAYVVALEELTGRRVEEAYVVGLRERGYEAKRVNLPLAKEGFLAALALWKALRGELYGRG